MFRILLSFASLFFNYNPNQDMLILPKIEERQIIDAKGEYLLYHQGNNYYFASENKEIVLDNFRFEAIIDEENLAILGYNYQTKLYFARKYDQNLEKIGEKNIFHDNFEFIKCYKIGDCYYFFGNKNYENSKREEKNVLEVEEKYGENIFLLKLDSDFNLIKSKYLGGSLDEKVLDVIFYQDKFYFLGYKNRETGGDFGYSGKINNRNYLSGIISLDLELESFEVSKTIDYYCKFIKDEWLDFYNNEYLYFLNPDLSLKAKIDFSDLILHIEKVDSNLVVFTFGKVYLYDIESNTIITKIDYPSYMNSEDFQFRRKGKILTLNEDDKNYLIDVLFLDEFRLSNYYNPDFEDNYYISSLDGEAELVSIEEEYYFDSLVYGIYPFKYNFKTKAGIDFQILHNREVLLRANVVNNGLYPLGYNLKFTGKAYLNDKIILNNYQLTEEGEYKLDLVGNSGQRKSFYFTVSGKQNKIEDSYYEKYDLEYSLDERIVLDITIDNLENKTIERVIVDGEDVDFRLDLKQNKIFLDLPKYSNPGFYKVKLEKLEYKEDGVRKELVLNKELILKIIVSQINYEIDNSSNPLTVDLTIYDPYGISRFLELVIYNDVEEYRQKLALNNLIIYENRLKKESDYEFKIRLVSTLPGELVYSRELVSGKINTNSNELILGEIELEESDLEGKKLKLELREDFVSKEVRELFYLNQAIYTQEETNYFGMILFSVLIIGASFGITYIALKLIRKAKS